MMGVTPQHNQAADPVDVVVNVLAPDGFTDSGMKRFERTVVEYSAELRRRSISLAEADKSPNAPREITHEHVRSSSHAMADSFSKRKPPRWTLPVQIFEYISTASAGVSAGFLPEIWAIVLFGISLATAVILITVRIAKGGAS